MNMLNRPMELLEDRKIFARQRKNNQIKVLAILTYHVVPPIEKSVGLSANLNRFLMKHLENGIPDVLVYSNLKKTTRHVIAIDKSISIFMAVNQ